MDIKSPYILPDGNVLISLSGGRTSGYMLHKIIEANGTIPDRCKIVFANTGRELPETLDFVQEMSNQWNVPIVWLEYNRLDGKVSFEIVNHNSASRNGEPFEKLITARNYLPNVVQRFCTSELKVLTIKRYLVSIGWKQWKSTIGIRADESRRINQKESKERWTYWYPLYEDGVTKEIVGDFWKSQPFDLRLFGSRGVTPKGNCDGCFLKSEATLAMMWREHPVNMQWWSDMENKIGSTFNKKQSYSELGDFVNAQSDWIFDNEAFLCQKDDGDCTG